MGNVAETKAASIAGPKAEATRSTGGHPGNGTVRIATSTTCVSNALDTNALTDGRTIVPLAGHFVDIQNEDLVNPLEVAFSAGAAATLVYGQTGTFAAGSAVAGWRIQPGQTIPVIVPPDATHFNHIQPAAATAATVSIRCSELMVK